MSELKPCPFCGGEADYGFDSSMILVECTDCYMATAMYMSQDIAAKKWNTRTTDSDLTTVTKQRDELSGALANMVRVVENRPGSHYLEVFERSEFEDAQNLLSTIKEQKGSN